LGRVRRWLEDHNLGALAALLPRRKLSPIEEADQRDHAAMVRLIGRVLRPDSNAIDVGAHTGGILDEIVRHAPRGRHLAFEPIPAFAASLRRRHPRVTVHELALSEQAGSPPFHHVVSDPGYSGIKLRELATPNEKVEVITVLTRTLDDVVPPELAIALLKIDVEGGELEVLRGAEATLRRHRPVILFEHGKLGAAAYGTTPDMIHQTLTQDLGYRIMGLEGAGPFDAAAFAAIYESGARWNFAAIPPHEAGPPVPDDLFSR
jgi:FkbM family methyltransferase